MSIFFDYFVITNVSSNQMVTAASFGLLGGALVFVLYQMDKRSNAERNVLSDLNKALAEDTAIEKIKPHNLNNNINLRSGDIGISKNVNISSSAKNPRTFVKELIMQKFVIDSQSDKPNLADSQKGGYRVPSRSEFNQYDPYEYN